MNRVSPSLKALFTAGHNFHHFQLSRLVHVPILTGIAHRDSAAVHCGHGGSVTLSSLSEPDLIQELFQR
jgi:hypothetical protein